MQLIAVDWSGRAVGAGQAIRTAVVRDGRLVELVGGLDRADVVRLLIDRAAREPRTVVGLDFSFSFPRWFCDREGWRTGPEVWAAVRTRAEEWLAAGRPPFWGRRGTTAQLLGEPLRRTERETTPRPKSIFQITGGGAVGTGSLRGMAHLADLAAAGFTVWPFGEPAWPRVVEIYPRLFAPAVVRTRLADRRHYLRERFGDQDLDLLARAAAGPDAFDAAVTALGMAARTPALARLTAAEPGSDYAIEGRIWRPDPP